MELTVEHLGGVQFEIAARGHRLVCDQPVENGGADRGISPPELLLASLGTCAGYYAAEYLRARSLATTLSIRVAADKSAQPARLSAFRVEVDVPGILDERHRDGVLRAVKKCLIHNTLTQAPGIEVSVLRPAVTTAA